MTDDELNPYEQGLHEDIERLEAKLSRAKTLYLETLKLAESTEAKLSKAMNALDEAIYMLAPDERDMEKKAGIYRIVTAYEEIKDSTP